MSSSKKQTQKEFTHEMIRKILKSLSKSNPFFVSEAHLQTEFIIEAAKQFPDFKYYPEFVPHEALQEYCDKYGVRRLHLDLLIKTDNQRVVIEFKYITKSYKEMIGDITLEVKSHDANDVNRYACWADIQRIERLSKLSSSKIDYGYLILITNVPAFWKKGSGKTLDAQFYLNEGKHIAGSKSWSEAAGKGTIKGIEAPILITKEYDFLYELFYESDKRNGEFRFLVVEV